MKYNLIFILLTAMVLLGCKTTADTPDQPLYSCSGDSDCHYYWFAGGCYTQAFIDNVNAKCQDGSGPCPSAAQPRENVTCTCENNACITHG